MYKSGENRGLNFYQCLYLARPTISELLEQQNPPIYGLELHKIRLLAELVEKWSVRTDADQKMILIDRDEKSWNIEFLSRRNMVLSGFFVSWQINKTYFLQI